MNPVAEALEELIALGVEGAALVAAIRRIETAAYDQRIRSLEEAVDRATAQADANRERERDRKRDYRERKALSRGQDGTSGDVRDNPRPLDKEIPPTPPKEINPPTPEPPALSDRERARADVRRMGEEVREAAGDALASMAICPGIASIAPLVSLLKADPPCDWREDILAAVEQAAAWHRSRDGPGSMTSWTLAARMARENRDRRLTALPPPPEVNHVRTAQPSRRDPRSADRLERFEAYDAASRAALRRDFG